jgi:hypothetical protein
MGAIDETSKLIDVLGTEASQAYPDREAAIFVLRNWISRGPDQAKLLYNDKDKTGLLLASHRYTPAEANILVSLLHDFSPEHDRRKETYQTLVGYMTSNKLAIRHLAWWHMIRQAQGLRKWPSPFDPAAAEPARSLVVKEWEKLIDEGQLPPKIEQPPPAKDTPGTPPAKQ